MRMSLSKSLVMAGLCGVPMAALSQASAADPARAKSNPPAWSIVIAPNRGPAHVAEFHEEEDGSLTVTHQPVAAAPLVKLPAKSFAAPLLPAPPAPTSEATPAAPTEPAPAPAPMSAPGPKPRTAAPPLPGGLRTGPNLTVPGGEFSPIREDGAANRSKPTIVFTATEGSEATALPIDAPPAPATTDTPADAPVPPKPADDAPEASDAGKPSGGDAPAETAPIPAQAETASAFDVPLAAASHGIRPSYADVYYSIPFLRHEYDANPSYRHEATMEILFGQLRPMVIHKDSPRSAIRSSHYDFITPYRYWHGNGWTNYNFFYPRPGGYYNY